MATAGGGRRCRRRAVGFDAESAVVLMGDVAGDGQPEARSAEVPAAGVVQAGEALEDPLTVGIGNAGSVVGHLQYGQAGVLVGVQHQFDAAIGHAVGRCRGGW